MLVLKIPAMGTFAVTVMQKQILDYLSNGSGYLFWDKMMVWADLMNNGAQLCWQRGEMDKGEDYVQLAEWFFMNHNLRLDYPWRTK